jgi:HK97 family phage portal protein
MAETWNRVKAAWSVLVAKQAPDLSLLIATLGPGNVAQWKQRDRYELQAAYGNAYPWVYACISKRANAIAGLPLRFYRRGRNGTDPQEMDTGALVELFRRVNPVQNLREFLYLTVVDLDTVGNAFWHQRLTSNRLAPVAELWRLNPTGLDVIGGDPLIRGYLQREGRKEQKYEAEEIVHFRHPNPASPWYGLSPLSSAALAAETDKRAAEANLGLLTKGFSFDAWVEIEGFNPQTEKEYRDRQRWFERKYGGKQHGVSLVSPGTKVTPSQFRPRDMEFEVLRRMDREEVCTVYGVPPVTVGIEDHSTFANYELGERAFWNDTVRLGVAPLVEAAVNEQMVQPLYGEEYFAEFDYSQVGALQEDKLAQRAQSWAEVQGGGKTFNEHRAEFDPDLPLYPWGEQRLVPGNLIPVEMLGQLPELEPALPKGYAVPRVLAAQNDEPLLLPAGGAHPFVPASSGTSSGSGTTGASANTSSPSGPRAAGL